MKSNVKDDVCYAQPKTLEQRVAIANDFTKRFKFPLPFGIDDMSNAANDAYAAWPERIYIVDESGHIAYRGGMGPFNYKPEEAREWLAARYGAVKHEAPKSPADAAPSPTAGARSEEHTSELQSLAYLVCRLLLEKKKKKREIQCV